ncbi:unnamed protein product [Adineta steineri]|uniref:Uncharacterized protein n=1 Tax=Adineta steineri TaxID=433720 RepID=A0A819M2V2_9BILA|nr:unnamed protein product [Adineta steineri]CAF0814775.1 unnamed protein product [Adineta steineri]CAF1007982.1 unnamed protein product [Adineta steineri]CAF3972836.1 unnamed protein product [Adineta steineri]
MSSLVEMNSPKIMAIIVTLALIMLLICPTQSMPTDDNSDKLSTRQKRWTFNTWRLHGRRELSNDIYSPKTSISSSLNTGRQYRIYNDDDEIAQKIHEHLLQLFQN